MVVRKDKIFWGGKRVLVTGHTGFKGSWLVLWLQRLGCEVSGISLEPNTNPSLFRLGNVDAGIESHICDIRDFETLSELMRAARPEIVFHLAAQSLVRKSYVDPLSTFSSNVLGTANVLESLRGLDSCQVAVMVTTDKVYKNREWIYPYRETDELGGHDPYSASKAASEIVISSYRDSFLSKQGLALASARAGNVIGGGDWSDNRLIPDAVRAWNSGSVLEIRSPNAIRPWQHVLEPLAGYMALARLLWNEGSLSGAYNFGPSAQDVATVGKVIKIAQSAFGYGKVTFGKEENSFHEASCLSLENSKAKGLLNIRPLMSLEEAVAQTINWYVSQADGSDPRELCDIEINEYEKLM